MGIAPVARSTFASRLFSQLCAGDCWALGVTYSPRSSTGSRGVPPLARDVTISGTAYRIHDSSSLRRLRLSHPPTPARAVMAQLRLRHPKGVTTIQIDLESATVQDLLQEINKITEILPSQQDGTSATFSSPGLALIHFSVKAGYPPKSLTLIPELPISSLGLSKGEQLIVNQNGRAQATRSTPTKSATTSPGIVSQPGARLSAPAKPTTNEPDSIETEGGYLVHRVRSLAASGRQVVDGTG